MGRKGGREPGNEVDLCLVRNVLQHCMTLTQLKYDGSSRKRRAKGLVKYIPFNQISLYRKQWIALIARADWLVKLRIFAIYPRATREKMASRFASVTSEEII